MRKDYCDALGSLLAGIRKTILNLLISNLSKVYSNAADYQKNAYKKYIK